MVNNSKPISKPISTEYVQENAWKKRRLITCDQDSVFLGDAFGELLDEYQITLDAYIKGDHNALGVIDSFAKKYKLAVAKYILVNNNPNFGDEIYKVEFAQGNNVKLDNNKKYKRYSVLKVVNNSKPISKPISTEYVQENAWKKRRLITCDQDSVFLGDAFGELLDEYQITLDAYIKGDHNALGVIDSFAKKYKLAVAKYILVNNNPNFGDEIYKVEFAQGNNVKLDNNKKYKRYSVLKVVNNSKPISKPISTEYVQENAWKKRRLITCDQDSVFLGDAFGELLDEYQITLDAYIKGDHNALGVIDSFAKKYKLAVAKYILVNNNPNFGDEIYKVEFAQGNNVKLDNNKKIKDIVC